MRRLILMRHAKSSWADPAQRDIDRPLNPRGQRNAARIGRWLRETGWLPDAALVSNARRTRDTWAAVAAEIGPRPTTFLPELYHADPDRLLQVLRDAASANVLMLGHQPEIGAFARRLLTDPAADADFERFPTAATAVVDFDMDAWGTVDWDLGRLRDFVVPRALD